MVTALQGQRITDAQDKSAGMVRIAATGDAAAMAKTAHRLAGTALCGGARLGELCRDVETKVPDIGPVDMLDLGPVFS